MSIDQPRRARAVALAVLQPLAALCLVATPSAHAELVTTTITCDNHYAIFTREGSTFTYIGGNETGFAGNPGTFNWSIAETWSFEATETIYVAAWSDNSVAQGLLAQFSSPSLGTLLTGDARWRVYATNADRNTGAPHPLVSEIEAHVASADGLGAWEPTYVGEHNGVAPWGVIAGITTDARWIWRNTPGMADPLRPGSGAGEMLIFTVNIPAPPAMAAALVGMLAGRRRRR
jgi:uncharacterized protein (TIGR03382 family)